MCHGRTLGFKKSLSHERDLFAGSLGTPLKPLKSTV